MDISYTFTLSEEDQKKFVAIRRDSSYGELLRCIRKKFESNKDKRADLKDQSSSRFVLSLIDKRLMKETIAAFPVNLGLNDSTIYNLSKLQSTLQVSPENIYDIRFLMPLIYHAVSPSLLVDCRDFIARRCLALTLCGLSSEDPQMRSLCYKILERYYEHLLSALMIDKQLWINLLDLLRNSIPSANARLRFIFTTFLSKIIDVLLHPNKDKMYELMKEFLAGRPRLRVDTIEIYDDLLLCSDVNSYNHNLRWLLTLFRDGLQTPQDLKTLNELSVIPHMMCLYNSELRFERANEIICSVFIRIASIQTGATLLTNDYCILPWLHQTILFHIHQENVELDRDPKSENLIELTKSISSLVFTLVDNLLKPKRVEDLTMPKLFELMDIFLVLHDLVIKSKCRNVLKYYLDYVRIVGKAIRKNKLIPDQSASHLLELIKIKMPYLS